MKVVLLAIGMMLATPVAYTRNCDGTPRRVVCHFRSGQVWDEKFGPDDEVSYAAPSVSTRKGNFVHITSGNCEVMCRLPDP